MHALLQQHRASYSELFRWSGVTAGLFMFFGWLISMFAEIARTDVSGPPASAYYQGAALMMVFAGYALGWHWELAGGLLAILGTIAFHFVHKLTFNSWPLPGSEWFAAPGVLYLLAWTSNKLATSNAQP